MKSHLVQLSDRTLQELAKSLQNNVLTLPLSSLSLARIVPTELVDVVHEELGILSGPTGTSQQLAAVLLLLLAERQRGHVSATKSELVMTGPEPPGTMTRDTGVVVRQMFAGATQSVCLCGFAVYQGRDVFSALGKRMEEIPELNVRMYLNIDRPHGSPATSEQLKSQFRKRFRDTQWPEETRLPELYFDPRPLHPDEIGKSACLHAKFVVTDERYVFVTSANFTEAAQQRNIELGILHDDPRLAKEILKHFQSLIDHGDLKKLTW